MTGETDRPTNGKRVAVIGGGISGLATAHRLVELDPSLQVTLLEASGQLGGVLQTTQQDDFCVELGPDSFVTQPPYAVQLCERIGFAQELIETNAEHRQAFIVRHGKLQPLPEGLSLMAPSRILPLAMSPTLSLRAKMRMGCELFIPPRRDNEDESLASFTRRRFGREAAQRLVEPLVSGIFMADAERLSMRAAMPKFYDMERQQGSLIRAVRRDMTARRRRQKEGSGPRYGLFLTPKSGLESLARAIAACLPAESVRLNQRVERLILRGDTGWTLPLVDESTGATDSQDFDAVIVATPAYAAARLLSPVDSVLAGDLDSIRHAGCVIVILGYARRDVAHALDGFGFLVPHVENRRVQACTFSSVKFAGRAAPDDVLLRVFLGGAYRPELVDAPDAELTKIVDEELRELLGVRGEPKYCRISRWPTLMPQYDVGHLDLVDRIERSVLNLPNLRLAGNAFRGVGITHCVHTGEQAAEQIVDALQ